MGDTKIDSTATTAMNVKDQTGETATDFRRAVAPDQQDFPGTKYVVDWAKWYGYYKAIPELQSVVDAFSKWTIGKGFKADKTTTAMLEKVRGFGKDTFNSIIHNLVRQYKIGGDGYAEIVGKPLVNLKPMNPGTVTILTNSSGIITGYEQNVTYGKKKHSRKFGPEQIFHLPWNRLGDEPHGISTIQKLVDIIDSRNEAMKDMRVVFHRYVKPLLVSVVDTDDATEIAKYKATIDRAVEKMENLIIPKGSVEIERVSIPQYSTLDPLPWIQVMQQYFILSEGVPEVILGWGKETTEASSKILYLAFQQNIEDNQLFLEQQIKAQLGLDVEFNFPADLSEHLQGDMRKEGGTALEGGTNDRGRGKGSSGEAKRGR